MGNAMNTSRNTEGYNRRLEDFSNEIYVVCPSCGKQAIVVNSSVKSSDISKVRLSCVNCGFNKSYEDKPFINFARESNPISIKVLIYGAAIDPYFHTPLWLRTIVNGNELWAFNYDHINFLEEFIQSKLRERNIDDMQNKSMASRLPRWMTSKKNREPVLKAIRTLKSM